MTSDSSAASGATRWSAAARRAAGAALFAVATAVLMAAPEARADGFADLRAALARPANGSAISGSIESESWSRRGEGADAQEDRGRATVRIDDGAQGLRLQYGREQLQRAAAEEQARDNDPKASAPTLAGLSALDLPTLRLMVDPAGSLLRALDRATPRSEAVESWNGQPARRLVYDIGMSALKERERRFVKKLEGRLDVWIATDGTPLESRLHTQASGRAYLVITFEMTNTDEQQYRRVGDRLVIVRKETQDSNSGTGDKFESRVVRVLRPASPA